MLWAPVIGTVVVIGAGLEKERGDGVTKKLLPLASRIGFPLVLLPCQLAFHSLADYVRHHRP